MPLRLCFFRNSYNDWVYDASSAGGHFEGVVSIYSNVKLRMMLRAYGNISVHGESSIGQMIDAQTGFYDGCIGR